MFILVLQALIKSHSSPLLAPFGTGRCHKVSLEPSLSWTPILSACRGQVLQPLWLPLHLLQWFHIFPVLKAPDLGAGLRVRSHESRAERQNCLPCPAVHSALDAAQDIAGFQGCKHTFFLFLSFLKTIEISLFKKKRNRKTSETSRNIILGTATGKQYISLEEKSTMCCNRVGYFTKVLLPVHSVPLKNNDQRQSCKTFFVYSCNNHATLQDSCQHFESTVNVAVKYLIFWVV